MNEKLKNLQANCSVKEAKFLELWLNGGDKFSIYKQAGFKPKSVAVASANVCRLLKKANCAAYLQALKDNQDKNTNISRSMQLNRLNTLLAMAIEQKNVSAGASVIREQNEMLGFHREQAPNLEKEQQRKELDEREQVELDRLSRERTGELSDAEPTKGTGILRKIG